MTGPCDFRFTASDYRDEGLLRIAAEYLVGRLDLDKAIAQVVEHAGFEPDQARGWLAKGMSPYRIQQILGSGVDRGDVEARRRAVFGS